MCCASFVFNQSFHAIGGRKCKLHEGKMVGGRWLECVGERWLNGG